MPAVDPTGDHVYSKCEAERSGCSLMVTFIWSECVNSFLSPAHKLHLLLRVTPPSKYDELLFVLHFRA